MVVSGTDIHSMQWLKCRRSAGTVMASAGARAYNGVWEPCPPVGSSGKASGQRFRRGAVLKIEYI